uniref:Uncharacterized protein n=1 Tax=Anopheles christyi TaxID=43041 RepID=A0A182KDV2_9DIPT
MRFFYRILIHPTAKLAPTASAYHHRVEVQDKNSTNSSNSGSPNELGHPGKSSASGSTPTTTTTPMVKTSPATGISTDGQRPNSSSNSSIQRKEESTGSGKHQQSVGRAPREETANNSAPKAAVNGHHRTKASTTTATTTATSSDANRNSGTKLSSPGASTTSTSSGLKMVLIPKSKLEPNAGTAEAKRSPPPLKAIQQSATAVNGAGLKPSSKDASVSGKEKTSVTSDAGKSPTNSSTQPLKCYVNLKTQTIVGGPSTEGVTEGGAQRQSAPAEIPRLKIDLKGKLSIPREKTPGLSPPSSSNSSAATSPSSGTSSAGKSPVWPMGKEEYAKTIGLKPVYAGSVQETRLEAVSNDASSHSSSHRKRKKGKHSKEAGSSGKRRKLHAEISSQQDASLKMKVKLTEKPPKHERLKSSGNEEESSQPKSPKSPPAPVPERVPSPPKPSKVIDITKDDDEVKFVREQKVGTGEKNAPLARDTMLTASSSASTTSNAAKDKLNEMRNVRHKPMVYIPNLDRSLSADLPSVGSTISSLLESVGAKVPSSLKAPAPALIPTTSPAMAGKSQPRTTPMLARPMPSCPPLAYPLVSSPVTSSTTGPIRTMAAPPPAIKRSISADSNGNGAAAKMPRLEPPSLMPPVTLLPAKQSAPIQAPMFNFAKGANRAKAAQQAAGMIPSSQPDHHIPYRSPISASYTKEIPTTKKPIPNLLLPPATVSVTKMSDIVSSTSSSSPAHDSGRPAVEILRIPPNAPVADKPTLAPFVTPKTSTKTTRPPPATIPLIKIKKPTPGTGSNEQTGGVFNPPGMTPLSPTMRPKVPVRASSCSDSMSSSGSNILDLSGSTSGSFGRRLSDDVIILDHSPVKNVRMVDMNRAKPGVNYAPVKRLPEMINFPTSTSTSTTLSQALPAVQKTLAPLPKLTEINRHRSLTVRQPNASIRSIPNPSALAFRGTQAGTATSVSSSTHSTSSFSSTTGFTASGGQQVNRTNGTGVNNSNNYTPMTSSSTTVKSNTSLSNGSTAARPLMGITSSNASAKSTTINSSNGNSDPPKPAAINGAANSNYNNNNSNKVANANTGLTAKKTIEKVAAVLKANAATVDTTSQRSPTTTPPTTISSSSTKDEGRSKSPRKEDFNSAASSSSVAASSTTTATTTDTTSIATAVAAVNRVNNRTHADSIVTSAVTTSSIASVTGANGGSSRNSPASIVNVG